MRMQQTNKDAVSAAREFGPADTFAAIIQTHNDVPDGRTRMPNRSGSGETDYKATYLWLDAGQSWPFLRGLERISNRALGAWLFVVAGCACWAMIMMMIGGPRTVDATVQMERLAVKLERTAAIPPETVSQLERLIAQPGYDCRQVACSSELAPRNEAARTRLEQLMASKGTANAALGTRDHSAFPNP